LCQAFPRVSRAKRGSEFTSRARGGEAFEVSLQTCSGPVFCSVRGLSC